MRQTLVISGTPVDNANLPKAKTFYLMRFPFSITSIRAFNRGTGKSYRVTPSFNNPKGGSHIDSHGFWLQLSATFTKGKSAKWVADAPGILFLTLMVHFRQRIFKIFYTYSVLSLHFLLFAKYSMFFYAKTCI